MVAWRSSMDDRASSPSRNLRRLVRIAALVAAGLSMTSCGGDGTKPPCPTCVDAGDAGHDGGPFDAGQDARVDAGHDAGMPCSNLPGLYVPGSCSVLASGIERFEPRYELWSDGAVKERFVYIPPGTTIDATNVDAWVYPVGTTFWKHFSRAPIAGGAPVRVETRMLRKVSTSMVGNLNWEMRTFVWNTAQDEVTEVTAGMMNANDTAHDIPVAPTDCQNCHRTADAVLGFSAVQLHNPAAPGGYMTLNYLLSASKFGASPPATLTTSNATIPGTAAEADALGYLHANCGHCHNGGIGGAIQVNGFSMWIPLGTATVATTPTYTSGVNVTAAWGGGTIHRIHSGNTTQNAAMSAAIQRMGMRTAGNQMPPLATEITDPTGIATVSAWINSLP